MAKKKHNLTIGTVWPVPVMRDQIDESTPCCKEKCMVALAFIAYIISVLGDDRVKFTVKATNHGMRLDIQGRRILFVFDSKTADRIFLYDAIFRKTRSAEKAKKAIRPFTARMMIESNSATPVYPPMTEAKKEELRQYRKHHPISDRDPRPQASQPRQLSM